jgi:PIN domain nuclease of toxin-antitoxin system
VIALDASALLAYLFVETGHEQVAAQIEHCCISTVNLAEVAARFARDGHDPRAVCDRIGASSIEIVPFLTDAAATVAALAPLTHARGLSLGDRACLALAMEREIPALTADRAWSDLKLPVEIRLLRGGSR